MSGALIVTAELGKADFAWLDGERRRFFPPERNQLSAHLTMFHALPPSAEEEARRELKRHTLGPVPAATVAGLMNLGGGVAYRIVSDELEAIRRDLANHFHGLLTAQDGQGWRPHVTIMNKAEPKAAKALLDALQASFRPRPLQIAGLGLHRYLGGPWEKMLVSNFR
ncbi:MULTISPECIES: 2'-5' RNA ligase family protein [Sphingomonas]|uniref:2'-5' RNA ligase family protein n=1 Tax=Sphingomonas TaxID=13687 RepID=UPI000DEFB433|nr:MULTISPECIES: 2'-5' RNA ligase family protein [Sphingomonas]